MSYLSHPAVRVKTMKEWTFDQNNFYSNQIRINEIQMTMFSQIKYKNYFLELKWYVPRAREKVNSDLY